MAHTMVSSQSPQDVFYDYLFTINPIAERIRKDVDTTKDAYQSLWGQLDVDEQNKIIEESIISPEIVLKYSKYKKPDEKVHEGGFSWFTRSQLDLCKHVDSVRENFFANECKPTVVKRLENKEQQDNKLINKIKSNALFKSLIPTEDKSKVLKSEDKSKVVKSEDKSKAVKTDDKSKVIKTEDKSKVVKSDRTKPKGPPPPPPLPPQPQVTSPVVNVQNYTFNVKVDNIDDEDDDANIPKTGFDFLDNW